MMAYDINVDVKYKQIEVEMLENYSRKGTEVEEEYDEEHIKYICEELYRYELLAAFKTDTILDDKVDAGLSYLWQQISEYKEFTNIVTKFSEKMCLSFEPLDSNNADEMASYKSQIKLAFSLMFNYDLYHIVHKCLRDYIQNGKIVDDLLVELDKEVDKMVI